MILPYHAINNILLSLFVPQPQYSCNELLFFCAKSLSISLCLSLCCLPFIYSKPLAGTNTTNLLISYQFFVVVVWLVLLLLLIFLFLFYFFLCIIFILKQTHEASTFIVKMVIYPFSFFFSSFSWYSTLYPEYNMEKIHPRSQKVKKKK